MENNNVILQTKDGIKLTAEKFVYKGTVYPLNTMKNASLKEGDYKNGDKLQIEFKDGTTKAFFLRPSITFKEALLDRLTTYHMTPLELVQRSSAAQLLEWITNINELIKKYQE